jgi:FlaA1/EpsC-like NDP-sugar epimerase
MGRYIKLSNTEYNIEDLLDRNPILINKEQVAGQLKDKCVLITGAAGSIGSELARQVLRYSPKTVVLLDQAETPLYMLALELEKNVGNVSLKYELCDVTSQKALEHIFAGYRPDIVYHAAAYKHVPMLEENPVQAILVNVLGTKNLADLAAGYNVGHFVMISTDKAVNPRSVMGASKLTAEKYVQALHDKLHESESSTIKFITTRFGNVLSSNGSVVPVFARQIEQGGPLTLTDELIERYFMTIDEASALVLEAGAMGNGAEVYIFYMGHPVKIIDIARKMISLSKKQIDIKITGLRPGEKMQEELVSHSTKMLPTHNDSIMIAVEEPVKFEEILTDVNAMIHYAQEYDVARALKHLHKFFG